MNCAFPFAVHRVPILLSVCILVVHVFCLNITYANMSVSGEIYEKSEETEKKEHIDKMVKWLKLNTSLKVLEEHEFEDLAQKASFAEHGYAFATKSRVLVVLRLTTSQTMVVSTIKSKLKVMITVMVVMVIWVLVDFTVVT